VNSIGRVLIVEFTERDDSAFDEVMRVLNQHSNFEQLQLKNMPMLSLPGLNIYPDRCKVYRNNNVINFTTKEYEIFYLLVINRGRVLTYDQIYRKVWNEDTIGNEKNAVKELEINNLCILSAWENRIIPYTTKFILNSFPYQEWRGGFGGYGYWDL